MIKIIKMSLAIGCVNMCKKYTLFFHNWLRNMGFFFFSLISFKYIILFCYWLCTYVVISPKISETCTFFHEWCHKYAIALPKIGKIHSFFMTDFFLSNCCLIECIHAQFFCRKPIKVVCFPRLVTKIRIFFLQLTF